MITFYLVVKNGDHENPTKEEAVDRIEVDMNYGDALKILRCMKMVLYDWIKIGRINGRINN